MFINRSKQLAQEWTQHLEVIGAVTAPPDFSTNENGTFMIQRGNTIAHVDFPWRVVGHKDTLRPRVRGSNASSRPASDRLHKILTSAQCNWSHVDDGAIEFGWRGISDPSRLQNALSAIFYMTDTGASPYRA